MKRSYSSNSLAKACTNDKVMQKRYGESVANTLRRRITQLKAASVMSDVLSGTGKWHSLTGRGDNVYAGNLSPNWRIVVQFVQPKQGPESVYVVAVEDYHKK